MRNGELECMRRSPDMRCSLQGAIEQKNNWVAGAQSQSGKPSAQSVTMLRTTAPWPRCAAPAAGSSAQQALEVRRQQRRTTRSLPGVKIASASAVALNPLFATRPSAECGPR